MVLNKGPQIHFWISEKAASKTEPQQTPSDEGELPLVSDTHPKEDCQKERSLPPYYHVEIF